MLVVVDGPMVKYHGKRVRHYVLTLMQIVSFMEYHISIALLLPIHVAGGHDLQRQVCGKLDKNICCKADTAQG